MRFKAFRLEEFRVRFCKYWLLLGAVKGPILGVRFISKVSKGGSWGHPY